MRPELFTVPGLDWEVQSYGFFIGLALVAGWIVALRLAARDRLPTDPLGTVYVASVAVGLLSARAVWVVQHPAAYEGWRSLVTLQAGTLAPFAGVALALVVSAVMVQRRKIPVLAWFDVLAPAFAVSYALERIGAFLAGTGHGIYAPKLPWSVAFPPGSPAYAEHRRALDSLLRAGSPESLPVHPTQLYGLVVALVGLAVCLWLRRRRRFTGQVFLTFGIFVLLGRSFVEEWFRADATNPVLGPFNPGQVGAIVVVAALAIVYRTRATRTASSNPPADARAWEGGPWSPGAPKAKKSGTKRGK